MSISLVFSLVVDYRKKKNRITKHCTNLFENPFLSFLVVKGVVVVVVVSGGSHIWFRWDLTYGWVGVIVERIVTVFTHCKKIYNNYLLFIVFIVKVKKMMSFSYRKIEYVFKENVFIFAYENDIKGGFMVYNSIYNFKSYFEKLFWFEAVVITTIFPIVNLLMLGFRYQSLLRLQNRKRSCSWNLINTTTKY